MRKMLFLTCILAGLFVACSNDEVDGYTEEAANSSDSVSVNPGEVGELIQPINMTGSPIEDFFNSEFTYSAKAFFFNGDYPICDNFVYVINSRQEFADVYLGKKELPEVDFDKYTLIIGKEMMPYLGFYITKKELLAKEDGLELTICAKNDNEILPCMLQALYYWGLYPKQAQKKISVIAIQEYKYSF